MLMRLLSFQHRKEHRHAQTHFRNILEMCAFSHTYINGKWLRWRVAATQSTIQGDGQEGSEQLDTTFWDAFCKSRISASWREEGRKLVKYQRLSIYISFLAHSPSPAPLFLYHLNTISSCSLSIFQNLHTDYDIEDLKAPLPYLLPDLC